MGNKNKGVSSMLSNAQQLYEIYKSARSNMRMGQKLNFVNTDLVRPVIEETVEPVIEIKEEPLSKWQLRKLRQALDDALQDDYEAEKVFRPKLKTIVTAVAREFNFTINDLLSHRKPSDIVTARFAAIYLARRLTLLSTTVIGKGLGNRDHSTIIHALRRFPEMMNENDQLLERVLRLEEKLKIEAEQDNVKR
jgi:chromosomal replication initiation ATPase DnaA